MPILQSSYSSPRILQGGHAQTLYPFIAGMRKSLPLCRERIITPDNDFLDLDWHATGSDTLIILTHGLEGDSRRRYMQAMMHRLVMEKWDVCAWNQRCCSEEPNLAVETYHSGKTEDLQTVVEYALTKGYKRIALVGFSMGGNQTLRYLGLQGESLPSAIEAAVVFSVPCDLYGSALVLGRPQNRIYMAYFMQSLRRKVKRKHAQYAFAYPLDGLGKMRTFAQFDGRYTAPLNGYDSAEAYWKGASSLPHLERIRIPTLLVNARNDPFLSPSCFPESAARSNPDLHLEMPEQGGHVGFARFGTDNVFWSEDRAAEFLRSAL